MKIHVRHWGSKNPPLEHSTLHEEPASFTTSVRKEKIVPKVIKSGLNAGKTLNRKEYFYEDSIVTHTLWFIEINSLDELADICKEKYGIMLHPPTEKFPYWVLTVSNNGRFSVR